MAAVDAWHGLPPVPMGGTGPTAWASAATSMLRAMANVSSVVCHVAVGVGPTRLRCLMIGHDDRFTREAGRLSLRCDECGRSTVGWTIGPVGPRVVSRLPGSSRSAVATGLRPPARRDDRFRLVTARKAKCTC